MAKRTLKDYTNISLKQQDLSGKLDFAHIFGRSAPVDIEIGSGRGTFLFSQAKSHPDIDFLGIEWSSKYYRHAVDRIGRWQLSNVRIIRTDAAEFLAEYVPDASVSCFHIYFPDPWPKKKHHKRRFLCAQNFSELLRCLKTPGRINIATDHAEYFEQIKDVIDAESAAGRVERVDFTATAGATEGEVTGTNYERKYIKDSRDIYTIAAAKNE